jgi:hypothetical protein
LEEEDAADEEVFHVKVCGDVEEAASEEEHCFDEASNLTQEVKESVNGSRMNKNVRMHLEPYIKVLCDLRHRIVISTHVEVLRKLLLASVHDDTFLRVHFTNLHLIVYRCTQP